MEKTIKYMLEVEDRAKQTVARAEKETAGITESARTEARAVLDQIREQTQKEAAQLLEKARHEAQAAREDALRKVDADCRRTFDVSESLVERLADEMARIVAGLDDGS